MIMTALRCDFDTLKHALGQFQRVALCELDKTMEADSSMPSFLMFFGEIDL
jgi:hypothetical protein